MHYSSRSSGASGGPDNSLVRVAPQQRGHRRSPEDFRLTDCGSWVFIGDLLFARNGSREPGQQVVRATRRRQAPLAPRASRAHFIRVPEFISEPITPLGASFDTGGMAMGEPGLPHQFRWRKKEFVVAEVLERWKDHGDCRNAAANIMCASTASASAPPMAR